MWNTFKEIIKDDNFLGAIISAILFILIGFLFRKKNLITNEGKKTISALVMNLAIPAMAFNAFMTNLDTSSLKSNIFVLVFSLACYGLLLLVGHLFFMKKEGKNVYAIFFAVGQLTFFSIPLLKVIYQEEGSEAIIPANIMTISFRIIVYIYSFYVISKTKLSRKNIFPSLKKIFLNPIMISMFLAIFIWATQNVMPSVSIKGEEYSFLRVDKTLPALYKFVSYADKLSTPLCMILIGTTLGEANIKEAFTNKTAIVLSLLRCILAPLIVLGLTICVALTNIVSINEYQLAALVIGFAAPVSAVINSYCLTYNNETYMASNVCFLSTIFSIITLPFFFIIVKWTCELSIFS